jgi:predicted restriction endonuclease
MFRRNVARFEKRCRVSGVSDARFLIASHIKPWRSSGNDERLDGENGLLLSPNVDLLFDRGFISFRDDGQLLVSPVANGEALNRLGVRVNKEVNVGTFTQGQRKYLAHHRREIFLDARRVD